MDGWMNEFSLFMGLLSVLSVPDIFLIKVKSERLHQIVDGAWRKQRSYRFQSFHVVKPCVNNKREGGIREVKVCHFIGCH